MLCWCLLCCLLSVTARWQRSAALAQLRVLDPTDVKLISATNVLFIVIHAGTARWQRSAALAQLRVLDPTDVNLV
jgi:hypothetical protein